MSYPTLLPNNTWFKGTKTRDFYTEINIVNSYSPEAYDETWTADTENNGSITCYRQGTVLTIAGNGSGKIMANADSSFLFSGSVSSVTDTSGIFVNVLSINGLNLIDTSNATTLKRAFSYAHRVTKLDIEHWDVGKVVDMEGLFLSNAKIAPMSLTQLDLGEWDTTSVENMKNMFAYCYYLTTVNTSGWNTSNVTSMYGMFRSCYSLKALDVSNWNTSKVTTVSGMFFRCRALKELDVSRWNTSSITDFSFLFQQCHSLKSLDLSNWNTLKATTFVSMFSLLYNSENGEFTEYNVSALEKITLGENFDFYGNGKVSESNKAILPIQSNINPGVLEGVEYHNIADADGTWYIINGKSFAPKNIPNRTRATYYASPSLVKSLPVIVNNGVLIDSAKAIKEKTGLEKDIKPSEFSGQIKSIGIASSEYFMIDGNGIVALKPEYRGSFGEDPNNKAYPYAISDVEQEYINEEWVGYNGSKNDELPERIVLPKVIDGIAVKGFKPGMFMNNCRVREIVFPDTINTLPDSFCCGAQNLHTFKNTEQITQLGNKSLSTTSIREANFPNLANCGTSVFERCIYLQTANIGDTITKIPDSLFHKCVSLKSLEGGSKVTQIGALGFGYARRLKTLSILKNITHLGDRALWLSAIRNIDDLRADYTYDPYVDKNGVSHNYSTPISDNANNKHWEGCTFTPCENPIVSLLDQSNPIWMNSKIGIFGVDGADNSWLGNYTSTKDQAAIKSDIMHNDAPWIFKKGCGFFSILHICSALSGVKYSSPYEFEIDLWRIDPTLTAKDISVNFSEQYQYGVDTFKAFGYNAKLYTGTLEQVEIQEIFDTLVNGGYAYVGISGSVNADGGHAIGLYGVNSDGEVMVVDSAPGGNSVGRSDDRDLFLYSMPIQNLLGNENHYILVTKKGDETS